MSRRRAHLSAAVGLALTALFLWLAMRNVRFSELWEVLRGARWRWLPAMALFGVADLWIRAARWRVLLAHVADAPVRTLFRLEAIGLSVNNVLFMRLGEIGRAWLAARELKLPLATALASVAVERAFDVAALLTLFAAAAATLPQYVPQAFRSAAHAVLAGAIAALAALAAAGPALKPSGAWGRRLAAVPALQRLVGQLADGAAALRSPAAAAQTVFWSLALWSADACVYWCAARALGLAELVDYPRSVLILAWAGAGAALPAAPGAIGTFEAAVKAVLVQLGVAAPEALGYAFFTHMVMYALITGIGLAFLYRVGLSLGELRSALGQENKP